MHIRAAVDAIRKGEYLEAYDHVAHLETLGGYDELAKRLRDEITETQAADLRDAARAPWYGGGIGFVLYLIMLFINSPAGWTMPVWIPLAFLVAPAITGYAAAFFYGFRCGRLERFWPSAWAGCGAMALYSMIGMLVARGHIAESSGADAGGEFLAGSIATLVYSVIAGAIAGLAGAARPYTLPDNLDDYSQFFDFHHQGDKPDEHLS
jgi:hypothetical protein